MSRGARPLVAIQGELGSFSDDAVSRYWNGGAVPIPKLDCARVANAVQLRRTTYGMLAMENSIAGPVVEAHDALAASPELVVLGEVIVPVLQCLLAPPGATMASVRAVYSHRMALRQCTRFFAAHPHLLPREAYDTAGAARDVSARRNIREGAIAGPGAAARYDLNILAEGVEDREGNETRFWVVARRDLPKVERPPVATRLRTALLLSPDAKVGAIHEVLATLAAQGLTVLRADHRMTPDRRYRFFIEVEHPGDSSRMADELTKLLVARFEHVRLLGTFPAWADRSHDAMESFPDRDIHVA
jgi:prephenate dehydratase